MITFKNLVDSFYYLFVSVFWGYHLFPKNATDYFDCKLKRNWKKDTRVTRVYAKFDYIFCKYRCRRKLNRSYFNSMKKFLDAKTYVLSKYSDFDLDI